ncbi:MAG TPA: tetratricopeptide repeat protein [Capsulimonadaceae bacterium]
MKQSLEELVKAIEANPYDPAPHTMSAEILRNVGRPDDAIIAYEQAINLTLPGAGRAAVEAKLARLVMEQDELNNAPIVVAGAGGNAPIDRSAMTTVGASAVVPGLGQFMAGEPVKGVVFFVIWASATVLFARIGMPKAGGIPPSLALACAIATGAWVASMVDAYLMVKRGQ